MLLYPRVGFEWTREQCEAHYCPCLTGETGLQIQDCNAGTRRHANLSGFTNPQQSWQMLPTPNNPLKGLQFSEQTHKATFGFPIAVAANYEFSIALWFYPTAWVGTNPGFLRSGPTGAGNEFFIFQSTGRPYIRRTADVLRPTTGFNFELNKLQQCVFVSTPKIAACYADGNLVHQATHAAAGTATTFNTIGPNSTQRLDAYFLEILLFTRALTPDEIAASAGQGPAGMFQITPRRSRSYFAQLANLPNRRRSSRFLGFPG